MHPISFAFKRGHIRAVVLHKELLHDLDITPARFDALFYLRLKGGSAYQNEIWYELGLHPSTISRMITSMVARGLVVKEPVNYGDGRRRIVTLTRKGFAAVVEAIKRFIRDDFLRRYYANMHAKGVEGVNAVVDAMRNIGQWLQDTAQHFYSSVAPPDLDAEVRLDEEVKAEVDRAEDLRNNRAAGLRGLAAIPLEDNPVWGDYHYCERNVALKKRDPAAWEEKISRDWFHYLDLYGKAYPAGGFSL